MSSSKTRGVLAASPSAMEVGFAAAAKRMPVERMSTSPAELSPT
jgi:hypothetical protein